jgi:hypothetical protein
MTDKTTVSRSERREVRNPMLALPATQKLMALPSGTRALLRAVLLELRADSTARAHKCIAVHKWPMGVYWKCVAVYSGHIARVLAEGPAANDATATEPLEEAA